MRVTKPQYWFHKWRLLRAVDGYPLYDPPHKSSEITMPEVQARENFDYFMSVRLQRLDILRRWMRKHFWFDLTFEPESAYRLDRWEHRYGAFLIDDPMESYRVFASYQPAWVGKYASYNVIFDIGVYVGEYVIAKRPNIHWEMYLGSESEPETSEGLGFHRPCLAGFAGGGKPDALSVGRDYSTNLRQYTDIGALPLWSTDRIVDNLKDELYLATLTQEERLTLPMKDLRHERLE